MTTTLTDFRLGVRMFLHRPVLAVGAVLSLALGIGANTAIFSVLHRVVLSPLPYAHSEQLVVVWETQAENAERWVAPANFVDWRREAKSFQSIAAFDSFRPTLTGIGDAEVLRATGTSGTFFTTLGADAAIGRTLLPSDDEAGAESVAVLSDSFWARAFGSNPAALGRTITLDGRPFTVVGVMPPDFTSPLETSGVDVWVTGDRGVPRTFPFAGDVTAVRDSHLLYVIGRLERGVSRHVAQQELTGVMQELSRRYPDTNSGLGVNVKPLHEQTVGSVAGLITLLQLAVALMLLIACANVAHLLLGQAAGRHSEMATRIALGARRSRLLRQVLVETFVIAIPGGVLGLLLAAGGLQLLVAAAPQGLPRVGELGLDITILTFTIVTTLATAIVFGVGPALHLSRQTSLAQSQSTTRLIGTQSIRQWHHAIVVAELAGTQVLLIGAGLLVASFLAAQHVPLGFATEGRAAAELNLAADRYLRRVTPEDSRIDITPKQQFVDRVLHRVTQTPGVRAAAASFTSPLTGAPNRGITISGRPPAAPGLQDTADFQVITPDFFRATGARLVRGRDFTARDVANSPPVAIVNQTFVDRYFAGEEPIGRRVQFGGTLSHEIVGIVGDMRYRTVESPPDPTFYLPLTQNAERWPFLSFTAWVDGDSTEALTLLRAAIREADANQPIVRVRTYDEILSTALAARRFNTVLVAAFAGAALLLAAVGTYGVMSFAVSVRTRELGVRSALGATPSSLVRLVVRHGVALTAIAVALGVAGGMFVSRLMQSMLYEVTPQDPKTFVTVIVLTMTVTTVATWIPARRVTRQNPVTALQDR